MSATAQNSWLKSFGGSAELQPGEKAAEQTGASAPGLKARLLSLSVRRPEGLRFHPAKKPECLRLRRTLKRTERLRETGCRWLRFNLVGAIGIGVQLASLAAFRALGVHYLVATALAVEAAVIHNFIWHERFTWKDRASVGAAQAFGRSLRFNVTTGAVSVGGNLLLMRLLVGYARLNLVLANLITIAVCSIFNFLVSDRVVFRPAWWKREYPAPPSAQNQGGRLGHQRARLSFDQDQSL